MGAVDHESKDSPTIGADVGEVDVMYIELFSSTYARFQMITISVFEL